MQLFELFGGGIDFEPKQSQLSLNDVRDSLTKRSHRPNSKISRLGGGSYGTAYDQRGTDVSHVLKVGSQGEDKRDAYLEYIKQIIDLHNPYFPQVNELKRFGTDDKTFFKIRLEKLAEMNTLTEEESDAIVARWYGKDKTINAIVTKVRLNPPTRLTRMLDLMLSDRTLRADLVDEPLIEALGVIDKLIDDGFVNDMGIHNIMIRRTKYGPQLVITDPIFSL